MRYALIIAALAAFTVAGPPSASAEPSGETSSARKNATQGGLAQSKAARKQRAKKVADYEPFCVRPFEYPKNAR